MNSACMATYNPKIPMKLRTTPTRRAPWAALGGWGSAMHRVPQRDRPSERLIWLLVYSKVQVFDKTNNNTKDFGGSRLLEFRVGT